MGKLSESSDILDHDAVPLFDKRLFATHGLVILTSASRAIMARTARIPKEQPVPKLTRAELHAMRCVVDGLRAIHKDEMYVRELLCHVITLEPYDAYMYVTKREWEEELSCYYIISGSVKVRYRQVGTHRTMDAHQADLEYKHGPGEILGLVSTAGIQEDISPPSQVWTREPALLLRVDRQRFHSMMDEHNLAVTSEKRAFLEDPRCILSSMPPQSMEKILPHVSKLELPANKDVVTQGVLSDNVYFVVTGRCLLTREVFIPEIGKPLTFSLGSREAFSLFAEECLVSDQPSHCTATTTTWSVFFAINRTALEVVLKEHLWLRLWEHQHDYPLDRQLRNLGYTTSLWNAYKQSEIERFFHSIGVDRRVLADQRVKVKKKGPSEPVNYYENLLRFTQKGSRFEPVTTRISSAYIRRPMMGDLRRRPFTAHPTSTSGHLHSSTTCTRSGHTATNISAEDSGSVAVLETADREETEYDAGESSLSGSESDSNDEVFRKRTLPADPKPTRGLLTRSRLGAPAKSRTLISSADEDKDAFTKSSLLLTMTTADIVRQAKALANKKALRLESKADNDDEVWHTSIHEENARARATVVANKYRSAFLRRRMGALESRKEAEGRRRRRQKDARSPYPEFQPEGQERVDNGDLVESLGDVRQLSAQPNSAPTTNGRPASPSDGLTEPRVQRPQSTPPHGPVQGMSDGRAIKDLDKRFLDCHLHVEEESPPHNFHTKELSTFEDCKITRPAVSEMDEAEDKDSACVVTPTMLTSKGVTNDGGEEEDEDGDSDVMGLQREPETVISSLDHTETSRYGAEENQQSSPSVSQKKDKRRIRSMSASSTLLATSRNPQSNQQQQEKDPRLQDQDRQRKRQPRRPQSQGISQHPRRIIARRLSQSSPLGGRR